MTLIYQLWRFRVIKIFLSKSGAGGGGGGGGERGRRHRRSGADRKYYVFFFCDQTAIIGGGGDMQGVGEWRGHGDILPLCLSVSLMPLEDHYRSVEQNGDERLSVWSFYRPACLSVFLYFCLSVFCNPLKQACWTVLQYVL